MIKLYEQGSHKNIMFHDLTTGSMVQSNQHIIVHNKEAMVLDPGGHKVYTSLFAEMFSSIGTGVTLKYIFFSHQDPDIIASANGWLMMTDARAFLSALWMRFIPHFGVDDLVMQRITPIPDEGMSIDLGGMKLSVLPAHFLHSPGNFQVYDPESKILYSGDLGASLGNTYPHVQDFESHKQYLYPFHRRYIPSPLVMKPWLNMVRGLDIDQIAPQHGAVMGTKGLSHEFLDWLSELECGIDLLSDAYRLPG